MENNLYTPEEFIKLKQLSESITTNIPEAEANNVWNNYKKISGSNENPPCMCQSAAGLWRKAMNVIHDYVRQNG